MPTARLFKGSLLLWAPLILQSSLAEAQDHARCTNSSFAWSFNSRNQDPCQIGEALGRVCSSSWIIPPLPQDYYYSGMGKAFASPCLCNTVYYTLTSVCGLCQGGYAERFDLWSENCTSTTTTYPRPIPSTVNVPNYAFLPLDRVNQTVDLSRLRADNGPESVGRGPTGTLTSAAFTPTGTRRSGGGGGSSSFEDDIEKEAKKVGIIAGVVVAVVWIVWAVGAGIIYWVCRRQSKKRWGAPSQMYQNTSPGPMGPDGSNMGVYAAVPPASPMTPNEKVYNPSDPSTFPQTPQSSSYQPSVPAQPSTPTSPPQYSTTGYQPSFQQQQQPYPVATPDRNTAVTPPGAAPQMMNPYEAHYQPQPQQAVAMPMVSYDHTGNSSQLAPNRHSMQQPEQHRQAFMSGVPQV